MKHFLTTILFCAVCLYGTAQPEINVLGNGNPIADGDATPSFSDWTEYISILECTGTVVRSYTIQNTGTTDLHISSVTMTGPEAGDFTITGLPAATIIPGATSALQVTCNPLAVGQRNATITINSDDADESVYDYAVRGTGLADVVNPTITCSGNINVTATAGLCSAIVTYSTPTASDNCPASPTITQIAGLSSGAVFPVGVTVNTFQATDGAGNSSTCSFSVTVTDSQAPVLYTMNTVATSNAAGGAYSDGWQNGDNDGTGFGAWTLNASTGNTSQAGFTVASSSTNGSGIDSNGDQDINSGGISLGMYANSAQATQAVRSFSTPLIVGRAFRLEFDNGSVDPGQIVGFQMQNSSGASLGEIRYRGGQAEYEIVDNNGITPFGSVPFTDEGIIIEVTPTAVGVVNIELTRKVNGATQTLTSNSFPAGGNQTIARFMIFNSNAGSGPAKYLYVNNFSVSAIAAGCPGNVSVSNNAGVCGATVNYNAVLASDNCNPSVAVVQTSGLASGSLFPVGTTTNSFSATDASGNTSTCSFTVVVADTTRPVANCQNISLYLNAAGNANIIAAMVNNGSTDNCGIASMSVTPNSFSCADVGVNSVTLTVTDASGNSATCNASVTVLDSTRPVATCMNLSLYLNSSGNAGIIPAMLNNGSYDNCGITGMSVTPTSFSCADVGPNNVTLTVTDASGNSSSCTGIVTVLDSIRPVANCQNITLHLNAAGSAGIIPAMLNNGSTDNCGIASLGISQNSFTCADIGPNNVTLTATDYSGNSSSCTAVVTVMDTVRPVVNTQNVSVHLNAAGNISITGAMINNGSTDACGLASMTVSPSTFNCANIGANNVIFTATDVNGNSRTGSATVTVIDTVRPVAMAQNVTVTLSGGIAVVTAAMINNGSSDACGIASMTVSPDTFTCSNLGPNAVTFTVTDVNGNSSSTAATVTVLNDMGASGIVLSHVSCFGGSNGQAIVAVTGGAGPYAYAWSPGGGSNALASGLTSGVYNCIVTDAGGCTASASVNITEPVSPLTASSSAGSILCNGGSTSVTVSGAGGTVPYTGTGAFTESAGTYSYVVTDANGCTSSTSITITEPAALVASSSATSILCNGGNTTVTVSATGGTLSYSGDGNFTVGAGTHNYTVTDANGCTSSTSITITEPSALVASSSATSILCNGGSATVTVSATGGTLSYSGDGNFTVSAGTHNYTVTDANGCISSTSITITEPSALVASSSATSILCNGGNATVTVSASGGVPSYSGDGNFTVSAGTHNYTVTDANGCTSSTSITITEPAALVASSSATSILCNGGNATVTVSATGGTPLYSGDGNFTVSAGTHNYTVTDANGCTSSTSITITEPSALVASSSATSILCNGGNAAVTVTANGGTPAYSGDGNFTAPAGLHSYVVTDANGCTSTTTITITEPTLLTASSSATTIACNGGTASVTVSATGGTPSYSGDGSFTVPAGTYSYTVTDNNGCTTTTSIVVTEPDAIATTVTSTNVLCFGGATGAIDLTVSGGTAPYTFDWNNGAFTTEDLVSIPAGTYSGVLTDANGCTESGTITITEPPVLSAAITSQTGPATCSGTDGSIDNTVNGGILPYSFLWSNTATTEDISGLTAGVYSCDITDANGCTASVSATLNDPDAPVVTLALAMDTICFDDGAFVLTGESPSGGTFSGSGVTAGNFYPAVAGAGLHVIYYNYTDVTGCSASAVDSIYVDLCLNVTADPAVNTVAIYPNPSNGSFTIQVSGDEQVEVQITDALGKLVESRKVQPMGTELFSIGDDGMYWVTVIAADGTRTSQRLIIAR